MGRNCFDRGSESWCHDGLGAVLPLGNHMGPKLRDRRKLGFFNLYINLAGNGELNE